MTDEAKPRECGECGGSGKTMQYGAGRDANGHFFADMKPCLKCNGTGRVWPSVGNEVVVTPGGPIGRLPGDLGLVIPVPGHRIIVQPLPAQPEK